MLEFFRKSRLEIQIRYSPKVFPKDQSTSQRVGRGQINKDCTDLNGSKPFKNQTFKKMNTHEPFLTITQINYTKPNSKLGGSPILYHQNKHRKKEESHVKTSPSIDVVIPVFNEEAYLSKSIQRLNTFLERYHEYDCRIIIADGGSQDRSPSLGKSLESNYDRVSYIRLNQTGKKLALHKCWMESKADITSYMEADLSTDLYNLHGLLRPLIEGSADLSVGTRFSPASYVQRCWKRELLSKCYNKLIQFMFKVPFTDVRCGFKAVTHSAAKELLPLIKNKQWFWDTELLLLANHLGYRIKNVPITWMKDKDCRGDLMTTTLEDMKELIRMRRILRKRVKNAREPYYPSRDFSKRSPSSYRRN